eukprot:CAMPEP_0119141714 /NCGR_PEP_ID=MMETSP1310-20130426/31468_1 /TAXON_ID=464262 /ORGANISM="Genus nov. species nov., Strain RCC2339" /LENGTH=315 /DNA_ID=CAMNT_0007133185 /DNA_START=95 /DNA_END=1042 /DNA_ORIENTATION=-
MEDEGVLRQAFDETGQEFYRALVKAAEVVWKVRHESPGFRAPAIGEFPDRPGAAYGFRTGLPGFFYNNVSVVGGADKEEPSDAMLAWAREFMGEGMPWVMSLLDRDPETQRYFREMYKDMFPIYIRGEEEFCAMVLDLAAVTVPEEPEEREVERNGTKVRLQLAKSLPEHGRSMTDCIYEAFQMTDGGELGVFPTNHHREVQVEMLRMGDSEGYHAFHARHEDTIVATVSVIIMKNVPVASVYEVATLNAWTRRGLASALVRRACRFAVGEGCQYAILNASKKGKVVYERLGFKQSSFGTFSLLVHPGPYPAEGV